MSNQVEIYSTSTATVHLTVRLDTNDPEYHDHLCAFFDDMIASGVPGPFSWRPLQEAALPLTNEEIAQSAQDRVSEVFPLEVQTMLEPLVRLSLVPGSDAVAYVEGLNWMTAMRTEYAALIAGEPVFDPPAWPIPPASVTTLTATYRGFY